MCSNVKVSIYVLLHLGSLCFAISPVQLYTNYKNQIYNNETVMKGKTKYCQSRQAKIWAISCKHAFTNLRKHHPVYNETYLHYRSFTNFNALFYMCSMQPVELQEIYMKSSTHKSSYTFSYDYELIEQNLTICFASPSIVPEGTSPTELPIYNSIAISVVPTNNEQFVHVMVFVKTQQHYIPLDWFPNIQLQESEQLAPEIFTQDPPTSQTNQAKLYHMILKKAEVLNEVMMENIVHSSDANMFTRLCILVMRESQYPHYDVRIMKFKIKSKAHGSIVSTEINNNLHLMKITIYSCITTTINDLNEEYYLSQGVDNNSVIVYKRTERDTEEPKLKYALKCMYNSTSNFAPVEMISNVTIDFLKEIDISKKSKNLLLTK